MAADVGVSANDARHYLPPPFGGGGGATATSYCYDCVHHIRHNGHLSANQSFMHDCLLCQLHSLPYVVPTIVRIAVFIAMVHVAFVVSCPFVKTRQGDIHSTRAPPVPLSL